MDPSKVDPRFFVEFFCRCMWKFIYVRLFKHPLKRFKLVDDTELY